MKTTMFHLSKGGVGKTTTSVLYAWYQRRHGRRVLFVDFDMQCDSTKKIQRIDAAEYPEYAARTVGTILDFADPSFPAKLADFEPGPFDLLASVEDIKFGQAEGEAIMASVNAIAATDLYDIVIFDTAPGLDEQLVALFSTVGNIIIPMRPDESSFDQISVILQIKNIADQNRNIPLNVSGIIINNQMAKPTMQNVEELVRRGYSEHAIEPSIDASEPIRIAMDRGIPLFSQNSSWARSKRKVVETVFEQVDRKSV